ncbi:MAG: nucleoside-diphosphate kinase [Elusimicrobia bacterium]|nr:nucleoside-diphosphate kinase [Elusimicrobiota bacterium]
MKQRTCVLIKPDGIEKNLVGTVLNRFEKEGFHLIGLKLVPPSRPLLESFYAEHAGKPFYPGLLEFMLSGCFIASVWEGEDVVGKVRKIVGATNSKEAEENTLRKLYGTDNRRNLVHASDSPNSSAREIAVLFNISELKSKENDSNGQS